MLDRLPTKPPPAKRFKHILLEQMALNHIIGKLVSEKYEALLI